MLIAWADRLAGGVLSGSKLLDMGGQGVSRGKGHVGAVGEKDGHENNDRIGS